MLPTSKEYLFCFYGTLLAGGIPVPLYPPARLTTIEDHLTRHVGILKSCGAAIMVTIPEAKPIAWLLRAQVESLRAVLVPADFPAKRRLRAGARRRRARSASCSTPRAAPGNPKGVVLTHANLLANVRAMGKAARATSADVFVSWLPLYHDMGLIGGCFATMYLGFPVVLMSPLAFLSRPSELAARDPPPPRHDLGRAELLLRAVPAAHPGRTSSRASTCRSWRFAFNGAEPVSPETMIGFSQKFAQVRLQPQLDVAGLRPGRVLGRPRVHAAGRAVAGRSASTASASRSSGDAVPAREGDPAPLKVVGCGRAIPDHELRVVDAAGLELPDRAEGSLQFRGPSATSGYYRNPEATKGLFDGEWVNTGDRAYLSDGMLYLTGREKDIIIRGGRNISPYELEEAVGDIPGVRRGCVAVFGSQDSASGTERIVVLAETREQRRRDARSRLKQQHQRPRA